MGFWWFMESPARGAAEVSERSGSEVGDLRTMPAGPKRPRRSRRPPSDQRYLALHPAIVLRLPVAGRERLAKCAQADGVPLARWLRDRITGVVDAHEAGVAAGRSQNKLSHDAALLLSRQKGRSEGLERGKEAGFLSGYLAAVFKHNSGTHWKPDLKQQARAIQGRPELAAEVRSLLVALRSSVPAHAESPDPVELFDALLQHGRYVSSEELRRAKLYGWSVTP